jgi:hypothetical protein
MKSTSPQPLPQEGGAIALFMCLLPPPLLGEGDEVYVFY